MAVSLALIILSGLFADYLFNKIKLPGLIGILLVGILFGPFVLDIIQPELLTVSSDLRMTALIIILLRAGLELKKDTLNRVGKTALVMACLPAIFEGIAVTLLAPLFFEIDYLSAAILGSILAAVSPAVVVPLMLDYIDRKRGTQKGIPTLILSASALDDIFVIVIFTILLGVNAGSGENIAFQLLAIPESILMGVAVGGAAGFALFQLFKRYQPRATKMTLMVISVAIVLTWLEEQLQGVVVISALLGVMTIGFILLEKSETEAHKISSKLAKVWIFAIVRMIDVNPQHLRQQVVESLPRQVRIRITGPISRCDVKHSIQAKGHGCAIVTVRLPLDDQLCRIWIEPKGSFALDRVACDIAHFARLGVGIRSVGPDEDITILSKLRMKRDAVGESSFEIEQGLKFSARRIVGRAAKLGRTVLIDKQQSLTTRLTGNLDQVR